MENIREILENLGGKIDLYSYKKIRTGYGHLDGGVQVIFPNGYKLRIGFRGFYRLSPRTEPEIWKDAETDLVEHRDAWELNGCLVSNPVGDGFSSVSEFAFKAEASGVFAA